MAKWEKTLRDMRGNPVGDWKIGDLELVAKHLGIAHRQPGTSHVTFSHPGVDRIVTVPAKRPIKPVYVQKFLDFVDEIEEAIG